MFNQKYDLKYEMEGTQLDSFDRRFFKIIHTATVDLSRVRFITWYVSPFSQVGTIRLEFWDSDPRLQQGFDLSPTNKEAVRLFELRAPDLIAQPDTHQRFVAYLTQQVELGAVTCHVDLMTLQPVQLSAVSTSPGLMVFSDSDYIYDPLIAAEQQKYQSEQ